MSRPFVPLDTTADIAERQIAIWRAMSPTEKLELVRALNRTVLELEEAGIRHRHPGITDAAVFRMIAERRLGKELAERVYGPADGR